MSDNKWLWGACKLFTHTYGSTVSRPSRVPVTAVIEQTAFVAAAAIAVNVHSLSKTMHIHRSTQRRKVTRVIFSYIFYKAWMRGVWCMYQWSIRKIGTINGNACEPSGNWCLGPSVSVGSGDITRWNILSAYMQNPEIYCILAENGSHFSNSRSHAFPVVMTSGIQCTQTSSVVELCYMETICIWR